MVLTAGTAGRPGAGRPVEHLRLPTQVRRCIAVSLFSCGILDGVTAKEQLHELVEALDHEQVDRALVVLSELTGRVPGQRVVRRQLKALGYAESGRSDLSERVDEVLAEGFGR